MHFGEQLRRLILRGAVHVGQRDLPIGLLQPQSACQPPDHRLQQAAAIRRKVPVIQDGRPACHQPQRDPTPALSGQVACQGGQPRAEIGDGRGRTFAGKRVRRGKIQRPEAQNGKRLFARGQGHRQRAIIDQGAGFAGLAEKVAERGRRTAAVGQQQTFGYGVASRGR